MVNMAAGMVLECVNHDMPDLSVILYYYRRLLCRLETDRSLGTVGEGKERVGISTIAQFGD